MADIALGSVEKIIKAGMAIKKAVEAARQNRVECQEIEELVATLMDILLLLLQNNQVMMNPPAINAALAGLERTLYRALELVNDCQESNITLARRILGSGDMSKKLRWVKDDILQKMVLGTFATTVQVTMISTNNIRYGGARPLAVANPQDAGEVDVSYSSHCTTDDHGSGFNNGIRMAATGSEVCYAPSSRSREFRLSDLENISGGGGHPLVLKFQRKEIIIRVQMTCHKSQNRAMKLLAAVSGVESVTLSGIRKDLMLVIGIGVDSMKLTGTLRKKMGLAEVVEVRTMDMECTKTMISAAPKGMRSSLGGVCVDHEQAHIVPSAFPRCARDDEDLLISKPNPLLPQHHSQHLRRHPFVTGEAAGSSCRNVHRPAWQHSLGSSAYSKEPLLSPRPPTCAEGVKGKGKRIVAAQEHQKVRPPHADARPEGQPPRGFMADARRSMPPHDSIQLVDTMILTTPVKRKKVGGPVEHLSEATADYGHGQQASPRYPVRDDRVPFLRMYGIAVVFLFLFFFNAVITSKSS